MNGKSYKFRRAVSAFALAASVAVVAVPAAAAVGPGSPGFIPSQLGSQDPKETANQVLNAPSMNAVHLYAPATADEQLSSSIVASRLGSQDPRETALQVLMSPSVVAMKLGSQDSRDTAASSLPQSSIAASDLGTPDVRDAFQSTRPTTVSSSNGFDWGKDGIEIGLAVCGLLLLIALGIGSRQFLHGGNRLRRA